MLVCDGIMLDARTAPNNADAQRSLRLTTPFHTGIAVIRHDGAWEVSILETLAEGATVPQPTVETVAETDLPRYLVWPAGEAQAPQRLTGIRTLPMSTGEDFVAGLQPLLQMVSKRFESDFNSNWACMFSRNYIVSTVDASSDDEVWESRRQWNAD